MHRVGGVKIVFVRPATAAFEVQDGFLTRLDDHGNGQVTMAAGRRIARPGGVGHQSVFTPAQLVKSAPEPAWSLKTKIFKFVFLPHFHRAGGF